MATPLTADTEVGTNHQQTHRSCTESNPFVHLLFPKSHRVDEETEARGIPQLGKQPESEVQASGALGLFAIEKTGWLKDTPHSP